MINALNALSLQAASYLCSPATQGQPRYLTPLQPSTHQAVQLEPSQLSNTTGTPMSAASQDDSKGKERDTGRDGIDGGAERRKSVVRPILLSLESLKVVKGGGQCAPEGDRRVPLD